MKELHIDVKNKIATYSSRGGAIVCNNKDYYRIRFRFDTEWDEFPAKQARFIWNDKYLDVVFTGDVVTVPMLSHATLLTVGVYAGENLRTTTPATIPCLPSILCESEKAQEADYYEAAGSLQFRLPPIRNPEDDGKLLHANKGVYELVEAKDLGANQKDVEANKKNIETIINAIGCSWKLNDVIFGDIFTFDFDYISNGKEFTKMECFKLNDSTYRLLYSYYDTQGNFIYDVVACDNTYGECTWYDKAYKNILVVKNDNDVQLESRATRLVTGDALETYAKAIIPAINELVGRVGAIPIVKGEDGKYGFDFTLVENLDPTLVGEIHFGDKEYSLISFDLFDIDLNIENGEATIKLAANTIKTIWDSLPETWQNIKTWVEGTGQNISNWLGHVVEETKDINEALGNKVEDALQPISETVDNIGEWFGDTFEKADNFNEAMQTKIDDAIDDTRQKIMGVAWDFPDNFDSVSGDVPKITFEFKSNGEKFDGLSFQRNPPVLTYWKGGTPTPVYNGGWGDEGYKTIYTYDFDVDLNILNATKDDTVTLGNRLSNGLQAAQNGIEGAKEWIDGVREDVESAIDWVENTGENIKEGVETAQAWIDDTGKNIKEGVENVQGWIEETGEKVESAVEWVEGVGEGVVDFFGGIIGWFGGVVWDIKDLFPKDEPSTYSLRNEPSTLSLEEGTVAQTLALPEYDQPIVYDFEKGFVSNGEEFNQIEYAYQIIDGVEEYVVNYINTATNYTVQAYSSITGHVGKYKRFYTFGLSGEITNKLKELASQANPVLQGAIENYFNMESLFGTLWSLTNRGVILTSLISFLTGNEELPENFEDFKAKMLEQLKMNNFLKFFFEDDKIPTTYNEVKTALEEKLKGITPNALTPLNEQLNTVISNLTGNTNTELSFADRMIANLKDKLGVGGGDVDLSSFQNDVSALKTDVSNLKTNVSNLQTNVGNKSTLTTIDKITIIGAINEVNYNVSTVRDLIKAPLTDLTDTTWFIPAGWQGDFGIGTYSVNCTIDGGHSATEMGIGYKAYIETTTSDIVGPDGVTIPGKTTVKFAVDANTIGFDTSPLGGVRVWNAKNTPVTLTFTGGVDVTNPKLIAWLEKYGQTEGTIELQTKDKTLIGAINEINSKVVSGNTNGGDTSTYLNLTNTVWELNDSPLLSIVNKLYNIDFTTNGESYTQINFMCTIAPYIQYANASVTKNVCGGSPASAVGNWIVDKNYQLVTFTGGADVTNQELINWLCSNGKLRGYDTSNLATVDKVGYINMAVPTLVTEESDGIFVVSPYAMADAAASQVYSQGNVDIKIPLVAGENITFAKEGNTIKINATGGGSSSGMPQIRFVGMPCDGYWGRVDSGVFPNSPGEGQIVECKLKFTIEIVGGGALQVGDTIQICRMSKYGGCGGNNFINGIAPYHPAKRKLRRLFEYAITEEDLNKRFITFEVPYDDKKAVKLFTKWAVSTVNDKSIYFRIRRPKGEINSGDESGMTVDAEFSNVVSVRCLSYPFSWFPDGDEGDEVDFYHIRIT